MTDVALSPAEQAAEEAWLQLQAALDHRSSFVFEAGAGAGKTHSLIKALTRIIEREGRELLRRQCQVACITFTNVARDQIIEQTDGHPVVYCETTHAFAWALISPFQKRLRELVPMLPAWEPHLERLAQLQTFPVEYALGRRSVEDGKALLHHDDIFPLLIKMLPGRKFRNLLTSRFPIILIDEYQDTDADLVAAFREHLLDQPGGPQIGFFGDHWQKIYGEGCGSIDAPDLLRIGKKANFRSKRRIVEVLNRIRPDLAQEINDLSSDGVVRVFHTNGWRRGNRQTRNHWQGDLPADEARSAVAKVKELLVEDGWDLRADATKILMLTHRGLATEMGYASLPSVFRYNDAFTRKANDHIAYFVDHLEPAARAFLDKKFGAMLVALDARAPTITRPAEKAHWASTMRDLCDLRLAGTVGDVIRHLQASGLPMLSDAVMRTEAELAAAERGEEEPSRRLSELKKLHAVPYREIIALSAYLSGHSPFETKHGVKGDQFENVLVVFGRGWNEYDFNALLEWGSNPPQGPALDAYERYRNLFYVVCSRPRTRLALLFSHLLSDLALGTLEKWFEGNPIADIGGEL